MPFRVELSTAAKGDLAGLRPFDRTAVAREMLNILAVNPKLESKTTIKLLEQPAPTQYRLRVGNVRVFYDVQGDGQVWVVRILKKEKALDYGRMKRENT